MLTCGGMVVEHTRPVRSVGYIEFVKDRQLPGYEALCLPLAGKQDNVTGHIIAAYDFQFDPAREGLNRLIVL